MAIATTIPAGSLLLFRVYVVNCSGGAFETVPLLAINSSMRG